MVLYRFLVHLHGNYFCDPVVRIGHSQNPLDPIHEQDRDWDGTSAVVSVLTSTHGSSFKDRVTSPTPAEYGLRTLSREPVVPYFEIFYDINSALKSVL